MRHIENTFWITVCSWDHLKPAGPPRLTNTALNACCSDGESLFAQLLRSRNRQCHVAQLMPSYQRRFHADLLSHYLQGISPNWLAVIARLRVLRALCG